MNNNIKSALWSAKGAIKRKLYELNTDAADNHEQLRYHQGKVRHYKENLTKINKGKGILRRELKKVEALEYELNPIKNIQNAKKVVSDE